MATGGNAVLDGTTGALPILQGGTGATTAAGALANLMSSSPGYGWFTNLSLQSATTTNAGDSVKITSADGTALSATNVGSVIMGSTATAGKSVDFSVTADVTILISGITPNTDGTGNVTGMPLRILAINDNGTLKWGVAYLGRTHCPTLLTTDTTATPASVTAPEHVLCSPSAVGSSSNTCREIGYVRANFTDAGNIWAIQTGINDIVIGQTADGVEWPFNSTFTGFSSAPTLTTNTAVQAGGLITHFCDVASAGTSNATGYTQTGPAKAKYSPNSFALTGRLVDASAAVLTPGSMATAAGSATLTFYKDVSGTAWTNVNNKYCCFLVTYHIGPAASFPQ